MIQKNWWEQENIHFECQQDCFKCCSKPGVVYLDPADIRKAAHYLNLKVSRFKSEFLVRENKLWFIEVEENRPCPFLIPEGCALHKVKPAQCKAYPFWKENLETLNHWKLAASFCPGIGKGPRILADTIKKALKIFIPN